MANGNLLDGPEISVRTEVDYSLLKINIIAGFGVLLALGFSYFARLFFGTLELKDLVIGVIAAALFLILYCLQSIFVKDFGRQATILFLEAAALIVPFYGDMLHFTIWGTIFAFLFFLWGASKAQRDLAESMKIKIWRVSRSALTKGVSGVSIFLALGYLSTFHYGSSFVSKEVFSKIIMPSNFVISYWYPGISLENKFSDLAQRVGTANCDTDSQCRILAPYAKTEAVNQIAKKYQESAAKFLDTDFGQNDSLTDVLYKSFSDYLGRASSNEKLWTSLVFGILLFLIIRSFGVFLYILLMILVIIAYEILIASGFALVSLETRSKDIITLK